MKPLLSIGAVAVLAYLLQNLLPWWGCMIAAVIVHVIAPGRSDAGAWLSGFIGVALLWSISAAVIDAANNSLLSVRISRLFGLPHPALLIVLSAIIGGLAGGFGALLGRSINRLWKAGRGPLVVANGKRQN